MTDRDSRPAGGRAPRRHAGRWIAAAALVASSWVLGELALASYVPGSIDDLFILLVYARHLAGGDGFRYLEGGPAVDGFTSLLDLLYKTVALRIGADPVRAVWVATALAYAGALLLGVRLAWRSARAAGAGLWWAVPPALAIALTPGLAEGTTYLLETPLYALTLLALLAAADRPGADSTRGSRRREHVVALAAFAVVLARPEGLAPAAVVLALRARGARAGARAVAPLLFVLLVAALLAWRIAVFGHWAPNSYYAKTSSSRLHELRDGLAYVSAFARSVSGFAIVLGGPVAALLALSGAWESESSRAACLRAALAGLAALLVVVVSGGDGYLGARLLAPVALLVLAACGAAACGLRGAMRLTPLAVLVVSFAGQLPTVLPHAAAKLRAVRDAPLSEADFACERELSRRLAGALPGARVAQHDLQCLAWFAPEVDVVDTSGINTQRIAHLATDEPVRFGRDGLWVALREDVELLHIDFQRTRPEPWSAVPLARLLGEPATWRRFAGGEPYADGRAGALLERYLPASVAIEACGPGRWLNVLVRADLAPALRAAGFEVGRR